MALIDLTGQRFGRLVVEKYLGEAKWLCLCDCGNMTEVFRSNLKRKVSPTKSCGCLVKEAVTIHNMSRSRFYKIWSGMKKRCDNVKSPAYSFYGGLGITYDPSWELFENFFNDMFYSYADNLMLDRKDPRGDYTKDNCQWIEPVAQSRNKKIYKTNKVGIAGAYLTAHKGIETLVAHFCVPDGRRIRKSFSLNKYTLEQALELAKQWRENLLKQYGYGELHGSTP